VTPAGYEYFDVAADVGVRAWGRSVAEAFAQAALGVLALTVAPEEVEERESREVRAQEDSLEGLLVAWVNECLYVHEIEGFAVRRAEVLECTGRLVWGRLSGEPLDPRRHRRGTVVKAATRHQVAVVEHPDHVEARLIVDV
jgi:SHS2 domain-containing protein